jgi:hypothetical protein
MIVPIIVGTIGSILATVGLAMLSFAAMRRLAKRLQR